MASRESFARRVMTLGWVGCVVLSPASLLDGGVLYFTDFESFPVGAGEWVGTDGWQGVNSGKAEPEGNEPQGIDDGVVAGLGKTAYLGFEPPSATFVSVYQNVNHDPVLSGTDKIEFEALVGIEDSKNGRRDSFFCTFYNKSGDFLAAIRFSNELATYGIWWDNGAGQFDTTIAFIPGESHLLFAEIDLQGNLWRASLDGIPLFTNAIFNATGKTRTLGPVAAEWLLAGSNPEQYGDNWMLVADWSIWAIPFGEYPFGVSSTGWSPLGEPVVSFGGEVGWDYQVEYSDDMMNWHADLPGSFFTGLEVPAPLDFTDTTTGRSLAGRYYRVVRTVTP
jgi:hypothetical protein